MDETRAKAHDESIEAFHNGMTLNELDSKRSKSSLDKTSGNKDDLVASYRLQYVTLQLQRRRQEFMKTKNPFKEPKSSSLRIVSYMRPSEEFLLDIAKV